MPLSPPNATAGKISPAIWAAIVAIAAFALYHATLLPGVDFGDTGSFQTTVGDARLTPRVGYPLYFAIGGAFLELTGLEPARALNLITAIEAAAACGLFVLAAVEIGGSLPVAVAGAALFGVSYTFWSQSIIAEVYALHLGFTLASLLLVLRWERQPGNRRLAAFFACYAIAFGNHLSTILLLPGFAVFLLAAAPGGWRSMLTPRVAGLAAILAAIGASQYLWNIGTLWTLPQPPASIADALGRFWFDVTKSDWRDTMVLEVPRSLLRDHAAMYWFDLRQQFGPAIPFLAAAGAVALAIANWRRALLLVLLYGVNAAFAYSYNVGDAHVFYLPSHLMVALLAAAGAAAIGRRAPSGGLIAAVILGGYAAARGYHDYPALDRSQDHRPDAVLHALTDGLDDRSSITLVDLNWQVANGLSYFSKSARPELAVGRMRDVLLYLPRLVRDNADAGRNVVVTAQAERLAREAYGPLLAPVIDRAAPSFEDVARSVPAGTRFVVTVLKPSRDMAFDRADLNAALSVLCPGVRLPAVLPAYVVVAGAARGAAALVEGADYPFRREVQIGDTNVEVRMESWLMSDTIRRMGFGHVIAERRHTLIVEKGISFATFDGNGSPTRTAYFAGIFALPPRYLIRAAW